MGATRQPYGPGNGGGARLMASPLIEINSLIFAFPAT
jgi:hypothetical protein